MHKINKIFKANLKERILEKRLSKIDKIMFGLPYLVWISEYQVDEEATIKICPAYSLLRDEYSRRATELNEYRRKRYNDIINKYVKRYCGVSGNVDGTNELLDNEKE